jgi:YD repeat-containing protein
MNESQTEAFEAGLATHEIELSPGLHGQSHQRVELRQLDCSTAPGTTGNLTQPGNLAGQPAPASWGSNTTTTGATSAAYNLQWSGCSGAAASFTDEANNTRDYRPDGLGRLIGVTEPNGNLTTYGYDMLDNLTSVSMGNRTFLYNSLGRQMCASNPESASTACPTSSTASQIAGVDWYTYDRSGNLASHTDARGTVASMNYDGQNRPTAINYTAGANTAATPNVSYSYDADTKGTLSVASNSLSSSTSLTDQLTSVTYPTGRTVNYGFDGADRVTSVTGPQSKTYVPSITYKPASIPYTLGLANGLTETYTWNDRLQLTRLTAGNALALNIYPCDQGLTACSSGNIGATWRETVTTNGALNAIQEFRHDSLNRLLTASEKTAPFTSGPTCPDSTSVWCRQFNYDAPGNRTIAGRSPSGSEAWDVNSISPTTNKIQDAGWSYDAAGNVIAANNAQTSVSLLYDAENRQVASCYPYTPNCTNTPGAGVTVYYYDGEGRRVE